MGRGLRPFLFSKLLRFMKQLFIIVILIVLNVQLACDAFKPHVIKAEKIIVPSGFKDCFIQLDTILRDSFILEIKNLPIDIATIKLDKEIGYYLEHKWKLNYYTGINGITLNYRKNRPKFMQMFFNAKIEEPYIIRRIIFRSYHNYLNNRTINIDKECRYYKNATLKDSLTITNLTNSRNLKKRVSNYENLVVDNYRFSFISLGDTLGVFVKSEDCNEFCYITGKLINLDMIHELAELYIFDIICKNRNSTIYYKHYLLEQNDKHVFDLKDCFKLNYKHPIYVNSHVYMWNNYVTEKFSK